MANHDRKKAKEYRDRHSSALNPRAHHVSSHAREQGEQPYKDKDRLYNADRYTVDYDISKVTQGIADKTIFWGDVDYDENWRDAYLLRKVIGDVSSEIKSHERREKLMSLHSLIANGGRVVVLGGRMNQSWTRWKDDPRILFWTGDRSEIERNFSRTGDIFPSNTHGVILSRFLSHATSAQVLQEAKRRRMTIMGPKNDGEVTRMLEEITTVPAPPTSMSAPAPRPEPPKTMRPPVKGELVEYAKKYDDATKTIREMGKVINEKLKEKGIDAKQLSVEQTIGNMRRAAGVFANPKLSKTLRKEEVPPPPPPPLAVPPLPTPPVQAALPSPPAAAPAAPVEGTLVLLKMIDDLQAGLSLLKDEVRRMHEQNAEYRQLEAKLAELGFIRK